jgi:hypothetical protein
MARKQFLINYHTSGTTNPLASEVKKGEIVVKHNDENPRLVTLKNNGKWAEFIDENAIDIKLSAVTVDLNGQILDVAGDVAELSGGVATELAKYDVRETVESKIATAKANAVTSATTYSDDKLAAAKSALTQDIQTVAGNVTTLSGNVDTKFADYATSADTETAIGAAKDAAIASAATYSDDKLAAAVSALTEDIQGANSDLTDLTDKVDTLIGNDSGKTVRNIANEELAAQLLSGKADADFKTLKDLAAWLEDHPESVAEINANITALSAATGSLLTNIQTVAGDVTELSGGVATELAKYDVRETVNNNIAAAKGEAITSATTYSDDKLAAAKSALTQDIQTVTGKVTELSGGVATELAKYDDTKTVENKIATAKGEAITSATTYSDAQLADAKTALTQDIQSVAGRVENLEKLSGATESAIQEIAVSGIKGVEVVESGTTRTIDFSSMIIDGGEY